MTKKEFDTHVKVFRFLDRLRETGATNMFGAAPYLIQYVPHLVTIKGASKQENEKRAREFLQKWMNTFDKDLTIEERVKKLPEYQRSLVGEQILDD